jgi:hypothetical protein
MGTMGVALDLEDVGFGFCFGDGLRCVGGGIIRLQVVMSDGSGNAFSNVGIAQAGGAQPGNPGFYQCWYRDPQNGPCGTGFNVSNGYIIEWMP